MIKKAIHHIPQVVHQALITLGKMFVISRKDKGWRQADMADRLGVTRQTIARIEKGDPYVAIGFYFVAAWILEVPIFPGIESNSPDLNKALTHFFEIIKNKYPQRMKKPPEKSIENDF